MLQHKQYGQVPGLRSWICLQVQTPTLRSLHKLINIIKHWWRPNVSCTYKKGLHILMGNSRKMYPHTMAKYRQYRILNGGRIQLHNNIFCSVNEERLSKPCWVQQHVMMMNTYWCFKMSCSYTYFTWFEHRNYWNVAADVSTEISYAYTMEPLFNDPWFNVIPHLLFNINDLKSYLVSNFLHLILKSTNPKSKP
jgi:hypothetical protein